MLIATQATSVSGTQKYFEQVLTRGDYYLGQEVTGHWHGRGVEELGLNNNREVSKEQFSRLLNGQHPETGQNLMQRVRQDRRPGMDLTFSVPKSVSLAWAINKDEKIIEALRASVHETMRRDVEPLMQRRVRTGKMANTRQKSKTGKMIYADFLHKTSRPVQGKADPHLHIHAFVINWTEQNGKHYAAELEEIVRQRPSLQAKFEARLARRLKKELGYNVQHVRFRQSGRMKNGWEIQGVERSTIEKFSQRTAQVEKQALEKGITDAAIKGKLGKITREEKDTGKSVETLRQEWTNRLTQSERLAFENLRKGKDNGESEQSAARSALKYSLDHHLHRNSTVERHQVVGTALEQGLTLSPELVEKTLDEMKLIQRTLDAEGTQRQLLTTREVLNSEKYLIEFARNGRGTCKSIGTSDREFQRDWLNDQQKEAVNHVLESRDRVMAITGGAGTGKSSLMSEAVDAIQENGKQVFTFAPSTGAKEVLEDKGFSNANTVQHLIKNSQLHDSVRNQVVWIDEAGLLDVKSMNAVFKIAKEQNCRVVLSGDTRQHASPGRGEAMRLLENEAGLNLSRVEKIQRQKGRYQKAIELISRGYEVVDKKSGKSGLLAGFDMLDRMGKIKEMSPEDCHKNLANAYLKSANNKSTLVVAPTHAEARNVTDEIRSQLREAGKLPVEEREFAQLKSLNLTDAEKGNSATYKDYDGLVVQFHQNIKGGINKGDRFEISSITNGKVNIENLSNGHRTTLPLSHADRFEVYYQDKMNLAQGDKIRFSLGGTAQDGKGRISNGRLDVVKGFDQMGNIILKNGWTIDKNYGHLDLGYVITSHASQGKDREIAIAAMGSGSLPAINAKQFYVTVSRGSEDVMIFVDNKAKVRRTIEKSGSEISATELAKEPLGPSAIDQFQNSSTYDRWAHRGRRLLNSFRDRVSRWRQNTRENFQEAVGRHRNTAFQAMGMNSNQGMEQGRT